MALFAGLAFLNACSGAETIATPESVTYARFDDVFEHVDSVWLRTSPDMPFGFAAAVTPWGDLIAVADGMQSDVKIFERNGRLARVIGRPGDGPGELRGPVALAVSPEGYLMVLDSRMRLSSYDESGSLVGSSTLPGGRPQSLWVTEVEPGKVGYLVAARLAQADGTVWGAYLTAPEGAIAEVYHAVPTPGRRELFRGNFLDVRAVVRGREVLSLDQTVNVLQRTSRTDGSVKGIAVDADWYRPPEWPRQDLDVQELTDWGNRTMWGRVLLPLGDTGVLIGYSTYQAPSGVPEIRYAVFDAADGALLVISDPAPADFTTAAGDTLFDVHLDDVGEAVLEVYVLRASRGKQDG